MTCGFDHLCQSAAASLSLSRREPQQPEDSPLHQDQSHRQLPSGRRRCPEPASECAFKLALSLSALQVSSWPPVIEIVKLFRTLSLIDSKEEPQTGFLLWT
eukprot:596803-Rhodomonas_salina.1